MVEIFSKRDGSDSSETEIKRLVDRNRGTINRLADQLTQGAWSARAATRAYPRNEQPSRLFGYTPASNERDVEPRVRISPNDRVVLVDVLTSRQIAFLGLIRGARKERRFVLATRENGFVVPLDQDLASSLGDLEGCQLNGLNAENELARTITARLGLPVVQDQDAEAGGS